jgi:hypothetical protein
MTVGRVAQLDVEPAHIMVVFDVGSTPMARVPSLKVISMPDRGYSDEHCLIYDEVRLPYGDTSGSI